MDLNRLKGTLKNLKVEKVSASAPPGDDEGWIPSKKVDVSQEGSVDQVFLLVLVGTGENLGKTRVALLTEKLDGSVEGVVETGSINELSLYYAFGELKNRKEVPRHQVPTPERSQQAPQKAQRPQHQQPQQSPRRPRIDIPAVVRPAGRPTPAQAQVPVERVLETMNPEERHIIEAIVTAGLAAPPRPLREMRSEEIFSHLSREVGGPLVHQGKELTVEEAGALDPVDLYEALEESKVAARS